MRSVALVCLAAVLAGCASPPPAPPAAPPRAAIAPQPELPNQRAADVVFTAMAFLDTRYSLGGNSVEQGFDCSGFTRHVFAQTFGVPLPRRAEEQAQARMLRGIDRDALAPGDLVFFNTLKRSFSHVGIYLGDGKFIHAPRTGSAVRVEDMRVAYWASRFDGARRVALGEFANTPALE
jgi:cell wall-associated NlpC family hydrolase